MDNEIYQRKRFPPIKVSTKGENTFCPECGFGVGVDEDGCCSCGTPATGSAVEELFRDDTDERNEITCPYCGVVQSGASFFNHLQRFEEKANDD